MDAAFNITSYKETKDHGSEWNLIELYQIQNKGSNMEKRNQQCSWNKESNKISQCNKSNVNVKQDLISAENELYILLKHVNYL